MQHSSILLIRLCFSKRPDPLGCTQLNLNRAVFSLNQRSRTNLAIDTPADWTSGRCCVDPLRPPLLSTPILPPRFFGLPGLVEPRLKRAVEPQNFVPVFAGPSLHLVVGLVVLAEISMGTASDGHTETIRPARSPFVTFASSKSPYWRDTMTETPASPRCIGDGSAAPYELSPSQAGVY
jgi:hypothetical protein